MLEHILGGGEIKRERPAIAVAIDQTITSKEHPRDRIKFSIDWGSRRKRKVLFH